MTKQTNLTFQTSTVLPQQKENMWQSLRYFNFYRIILSAIFVSASLLNKLDKTVPILGVHDQQLFYFVGVSYFFLSLLGHSIIHWRITRFEILVHILVFFDIIMLTLVMHASGSVNSGLGMLIVVAIAGNSLITEGRTARLFAAIAVLAMLIEQSFTYAEGLIATNFTQAGILGIVLFATATLSHVLSKRIQETEELAAQRGMDLDNMEQLNEYVIQQLQAGIIVIDNKFTIHLMNESARHMLSQNLNTRLDTYTKHIQTLSPPLYEQLIQWQSNHNYETHPIQNQLNSIEMLPSFTQLGNSSQAPTLISLEDATHMAQQAQQIKLAALGRLTASIAHEIRNPLGAISHAEQLLAESEQLNKSDKRLTEIIHNNAERVNAIIENVMQLSRRGNVISEDVSLSNWINKFIGEFIIAQNISPNELAFHIQDEETIVHIDSTQLNQILWNLCHNGLRHSQEYQHSPKLELQVTSSKQSKQVYLDVIDHGPGINQELAQKIFEPFFTTETNGSGLGLYIARELCKANQAHLSYQPSSSGGSCFRISFSADQI